ncbi:unnamed protein product [Caenorhabditis angaria]|uniref:UDP-glucuronosyltransferase n=1 Tax=Caenorhabditis angaria TaxID=860376 RepID=A0A9P1IXB7_9PELO|nr:unnamed protein product [Caenorhabditis angaria]
MRVLLFFLSLLNLLTTIFSYNALIYSPAFATSHMNFMAHLSDTLTEAGHNVTFLVPISEESLRNRIKVRTRHLINVEQDEIYENHFWEAGDELMQTVWTYVESPEKNKEKFKLFENRTIETCGLLIRNRKVLEILQNTKFDVSITEPLSICGLAYSKILGIEKTIIASSCTMYDHIMYLIGEPDHPSYVPAMQSTYTDKMNLYERYQNYQYSVGFIETMQNVFEAEIQLFSEWNISNWHDLYSETSLHFVNSNPYIDFPRPIIQKTVSIGGISVNLEKIKSEKLSDEWNNILYKRNQNMLISFGSIAKSMDIPIEWKSNILDVIKLFPNVTFIWKYESDDLEWAENIENIVFMKWIPQTALLNDKRVNAFLTHGGLGSTNELAYLGKPAIMIPIFADQMRNANMLRRHNGTISLSKFDLGNLDLLKKSINSILNYQKYSKNAEQLASLLSKQPMEPKETVIKYVEFVSKFGPFPTMDPSSRNMSKIQIYMLDIYFILFFSYFITLIGFVFTVRLLFNYLNFRSTKNKTKNKLN